MDDKSEQEKTMEEQKESGSGDGSLAKQSEEESTHDPKETRKRKRDSSTEEDAVEKRMRSDKDLSPVQKEEEAASSKESSESSLHNRLHPDDQESAKTEFTDSVTASEKELDSLADEEGRRENDASGDGAEKDQSGSDDEDPPVVVKKKKQKDVQVPAAVPVAPPKPKMSALKRKELRRERMEQKRQERLAKKKAEREAFLDKLENTKIGDLLKMQENPRLVQLRKFVCAAGFRCNYKQLFKDCLTDEEKIDKLESFMESKGLKVRGPLTIEQCKKFKMKRDREKELADLDVGNIIISKGRSLRSRGEPKEKRKKELARERSSSDEEVKTEEASERKEESDKEDSDSESEAKKGFKAMFSGLQGVVDSGGEDSS